MTIRFEPGPTLVCPILLRFEEVERRYFINLQTWQIICVGEIVRIFDEAFEIVEIYDSMTDDMLIKVVVRPINPYIYYVADGWWRIEDEDHYRDEYFIDDYKQDCDEKFAWSQEGF